MVFKRNQELWNKIWQMHENGESIYKIAKKLNVSTSTVHYAIKKMKKERDEPNKAKTHEQHEEVNELINDITAKKEEVKKKKKKEIREVDRIWAILEI